MTANPLVLRPDRPALGGIGRHGQPLDIDGYCAWLNGKSGKMGWRWHVVTREDGKREIGRSEVLASSEAPRSPVRHWSEADAA